MSEAVFYATSAIFAFGLGFYLISTLQWFSYRFERILFHFTKPLWHIFLAVLPFLIFCVLSIYYPEFGLFFSLFYFVILLFWHKKLDKRLVFTARVWRFFAFLAICLMLFSLVTRDQIFIVSASLISAFILMEICEKALFLRFKNRAIDKLKSMPDLVIVMITASFGKTSIKNFTFEILSSKFKTQKTPRSVNTFGGIIRDINEHLKNDTQIYIVEAGARQKGDIAEICELLNPQFVIIGEIGEMHIEYFKNIQNVRATKLEALASNRLKFAFLHSSTLQNEGEKFCIYDKKVTNINSDLDKTTFRVENLDLRANILGAFNAENIAVSVLLAKKLGVGENEIKEAVLKLKSVKHRLERMDNCGKIIIDDSFNGNLSGMKGSYELVKSYIGRKIVLTPGIIEGDKKLNEELAKAINEVFDIVVITSGINEKALKKFLNQPEIFVIKKKKNIASFLATNTMSGDLILFSNDAPSFI